VLNMLRATGLYVDCVLTGSAAIRHMLVHACATNQPNIKPVELRELTCLCGALNMPRDADFLVTGSTPFLGKTYLPRSLNVFEREQKCQTKSATYNGIGGYDEFAFDLTFVEGSMRYIEVGGVYVIAPKTLKKFYEDDLGIKNRNAVQDNLKIRACTLLAGLYDASAKDVTISTLRSRRSPDKKDRDRSPVRKQTDGVRKRLFV
jgi:hypothetical protein